MFTVYRKYTKDVNNIDSECVNTTIIVHAFYILGDNVNKDMSTISREKGAIFCPVHPKKKMSFLCKQCNVLICNKCIIKEHFGHPVEEIEDIAEKTFGKIDDFITKTEEITIPRTKQIIQQVEAQVHARENELEDAIEIAYKHEKYLIELVKKNRHKTVSELKGEIQTINQQLSQFKSESDTYLVDLKQAVQECKETKKTKNDILLIDVVNGVEKLDDNPPNCQLQQTRKEFSPGLNPTVDIASAFGCVSNDGDQASVGIQYRRDNTKPEHLKSSLEKKHRDLHSTGASAPTKGRQLLSQPQVTQYKDLPSSYPHSIEKFSDGTLCYCCNNEPNVYLVDKSGDIKKLKLDITVCYIAIHPTTDVLYIIECYYARSIRTVDIHTGTTSVVITTLEPPFCMTLTADRTILVGFFNHNKVVQYTLRGQVLKSFIVTKPWHISVCDITGNIVIAGRESGAHILNKDFQKIIVYKGPMERPSTIKELFYCCDAVFDTEGHILIGDLYNKEVHVVDAGTGQHMKTITLDNFGDIRRLCLHQDGQLVVGTSELFGSSPKLVFVKYM